MKYSREKWALLITSAIAAVLTVFVHQKIEHGQIMLTDWIAVVIAMALVVGACLAVAWWGNRRA